MILKGLITLLSVEVAAAAGLITYLAVSDVIGAAAIAAIASVANTCLLIYNRRQARQLVGERDPDQGPALEELALVRAEIKDQREMLASLKRLSERKRREVRGSDALVMEDGPE